jgi:demethoxyubiquinone hydroxylase (CLK1/Coq7/Cat5 family)
LEHLDSVEEILAAQKRVARDVYTGVIGSRAAGSINHALETLLNHHLQAKELAEMQNAFARLKILLKDQEKDETKQHEQDAQPSQDSEDESKPTDSTDT